MTARKPPPSYINEGLHKLVVPIGRLKPHPYNARRGVVPAIASSLERFGQVRPVKFQRSSGYVLAGNHVLLAARHLDWSHLAAVPLELDDDEALAYLVADNATADRGGYDQDALSGVLERITARGDGALAGTGYSDADVTMLLERAEARRNAQPAPPPARPGPADAGPSGIRELELTYDADNADRFTAALERAQLELGVETAREAVLEAVKRAADRITETALDLSQGRTA